MSTTISIASIDDFVVVGGFPNNTGSVATLQRRDRLTAETLAAAGHFKPQGVLSGSFIYAHPPDYRGRPSLRYSVLDWRNLFRELKALGMDTVIWQASAFMEIQECYYPSSVLSGYKQWNVLEPMMQAASDENMFLFLGTFGVLDGQVSLGVLESEPTKAIEAADRELACYKEILQRFGGGFDGYYLSSETFYASGFAPIRYHRYSNFFERVTHGVKELTPHLKILASPGTPSAQGREQEATERLLECFSKAKVDFIAPMDCVGQANSLADLKTGLNIWKTICREINAEFWTNCEAFSVTDYTTYVMEIEAADPRRFSYQLTTAMEVGARKLVTWEAMHFMDPHGDAKAKALLQGYQAHRQDVANSGKAPAANKET